MTRGNRPETELIAATMRKALREVCRDNGVCFVPGSDFNPSDYYKFTPTDVAAIHNHKRGTGAGLWFRLRDGRVFDRTGAADERDPLLYDTWLD